MGRKIECHPAIVERITVEETQIAEVRKWIEAQASSHNLTWLLAYADDGVIWGKMEQGSLVTSYDAVQKIQQTGWICPQLRVETLQQARLFGDSAELLLWRDGDNHWQARMIRDAEGSGILKWRDTIDEEYMLWGTHGQPLGYGFTLLRDGSQGLRHAVPCQLTLEDSQGKTTPPRLVVRHYLSESENGFNRIVCSRLVTLGKE